MLIAYCTDCQAWLGSNKDEPMVDVLKQLATAGRVILGSLDDPDTILCHRCSCAAWLGKDDKNDREIATFIGSGWETWAGTGPAATAVLHSGDIDATVMMRASFDEDVLRRLNVGGLDPRILDYRERARRVTDAIEQVDPEQIAAHVAWLCEIAVPAR